MQKTRTWRVFCMQLAGRLLDREVLQFLAGLQRGDHPQRLAPAPGPGLTRVGGVAVLRGHLSAGLLAPGLLARGALGAALAGPAPGFVENLGNVEPFALGEGDELFRQLLLLGLLARIDLRLARLDQVLELGDGEFCYVR